MSRAGRREPGRAVHGRLRRGLRPINEILAGATPMLMKGAAVFAYAEALKEFKKTGEATSLDPALAAVTAADVVLPGDTDLAKIRMVVETLAGK